jgi:D-serine deaminase-like pyridoxal phosphate-dependent protein
MKILYSLNTPCLVVDRALLFKNIKTMASFAKRSAVSLRPHFKTHKCVEIARLQIKYGAIGITCATIDEAEALVKGGIKSVLIANQLTDDNKIKRLLKLQKKNNQIIVGVENETNLVLLNDLAGKQKKKINVLVEVDTGMERLGRKPGADTLYFAGLVRKMKNINLLGLMGYEGHTVFIRNKEERIKKAHKAVKHLTESAKLLSKNEIPAWIVSAGGTGTYDITGKIPGITELQTGSYVFMDQKYSSLVKGFDKCLSVLSTICGVRDDGTYIIDAGRKAVSSEFGDPLVGKEPVLKFSEEHSKVKGVKVFAGQRVLVTPTHCCTTVNLHEKLHVIDKGCAAKTWKIHRARL